MQSVRIELVNLNPIRQKLVNQNGGLNYLGAASEQRDSVRRMQHHLPANGILPGT